MMQLVSTTEMFVVPPKGGAMKGNPETRLRTPCYQLVAHSIVREDSTSALTTIHSSDLETESEANNIMSHAVDDYIIYCHTQTLPLKCLELSTDTVYEKYGYHMKGLITVNKAFKKQLLEETPPAPRQRVKISHRPEIRLEEEESNDFVMTTKQNKNTTPVLERVPFGDKVFFDELRRIREEKIEKLHSLPPKIHARELKNIEAWYKLEKKKLRVVRTTTQGKTFIFSDEIRLKFYKITDVSSDYTIYRLRDEKNKDEYPSIVRVNKSSHSPPRNNVIEPDAQVPPPSEMDCFLDIARAALSASGMIADYFWPYIDFLYRIYKSRTAVDVFMATISAAQNVLGMSLFQQLGDKIVNDWVPLIVGTMSRWWNRVETQSFGDSMEKFLSNIQNFADMFVECSLLIHVRDLFLGLVSMKLFDKDVAKSIYFLMGKPRDVSLYSISRNFLDALAVLTKFGNDLSKGASLKQALFANSHGATFTEEARTLTYFSDKLYSGIPVHGHMERSEFVTRINELISRGQLRLEKLPVTSLMRVHLHKEVLGLLAVKNEVITTGTRGRRAAPLLMILAGDPGVGKSFLIQHICQVDCHIRGRPFFYSMIYQRDMNQDFFEGLQPLSQPYCHYGEGSSETTAIAKMGQNKINAEILSQCDNLEKSLTMAFDQKGKVKAAWDLLLLDTNNPGLHYDSTLYAPAAGRRRGIYTIAYVRPEYRVEARDPATGLMVTTSALDSAKVHANPPKIPNDLWIFDVYKEHPKNNRDSIREYLLRHNEEDAGIVKYTQVIAKLFRDHIVSQARIGESTGLAFPAKEYLGEDPVSHLPPTTKLVDPKPFLSDAENIMTTLGDRNYDEAMAWLLPPVVADLPEVIPVDVQSLRDCISMPFDEDYYQNRFYAWVADPLMKVVPHYSRVSYIGDTLSNLYVNIETLVITTLLIMLMWITDRLPDNRHIPRKNWYVFVPCLLLVSMIYGVTWWILVPLILIFVYTSVSRSSLKGPILTTLKDNTMKPTLKRQWKEAFRNLLGWGTPEVSDSLEYFLFKRSLVLIGGALTLGAAVTAVYRYVKRPRVSKDEVMDDPVAIVVEDTKPVEVQSSDFLKDSEWNKLINEVEEKCETGLSRERLPNKVDSSIWNVLTPNIPTRGNTNKASVLEEVVQINRREVIVDTPAGSNRVFLLGLCKNYALINRHAFAGEKTFSIRMTRKGELGTVTGDMITHTFSGTDKDIIPVVGDLVMLRTRGDQFKDILHHLIDVPLNVHSYTGIVNGTSVVASVITSKFELSGAGSGPKIVEMPALYYEYSMHYDGMCGTPVILDCPGGARVCGIHFGIQTNTNKCLAVIVNSRIISGIIDKLENDSLLISPLSLGTVRLQGALERPNPKSMVYYLPIDNATYLGRKPGNIILQDSKLLHSPMLSLIPDLLTIIPAPEGLEEFGPPLLRAKGKGSSYINPYNIAVSKFNRQKGFLNPDLLESVIGEVRDHIISGLRDKGITSLKPLDMKVAINGIKTDPFIRRVNTSTGAGPHLGKKKAYWLPVVHEDQEMVIREPTDNVKHDIVNILMRYIKHGESSGIMSEGLLKDEPRGLQKIIDGSTRMFYSTDLDNLILARMFLSPILTLLIEQGAIFGSAIGINAHNGADQYVRSRLAFSKYIVEGDMSAFDLSPPYDIKLAVASLLYALAKDLGYNASALKVVKGLLTETLHPLVSVLQDVFIMHGLTISGGNATAELNTLLLLLIQVYCYRRLVPQEFGSFFTNVLCGNYGDDGNMSVDGSIIHLYNNLTIQRVLKEEFKMDYTSSSKSKELTAYCSITESVFLKRNFVYRTDLHRWVAPLIPSSLYKMFSWYLPSGSIPELEQIRATCFSFLWESVLHVGEEDHEKVRLLIESHLNKHYGEGAGDSLPCYGEITSSMFT